jgi:hypothetical protein
MVNIAWIFDEWMNFHRSLMLLYGRQTNLYSPFSFFILLLRIQSNSRLYGFFFLVLKRRKKECVTTLFLLIFDYKTVILNGKNNIYLCHE